jgi:hypothetical protein
MTQNKQMSRKYGSSPIPNRQRLIKLISSSCDGEKPEQSNGSWCLGDNAVFFSCKTCGNGAWGSNRNNAAQIWNEGHSA